MDHGPASQKAPKLHGRVGGRFRCLRCRIRGIACFGLGLFQAKDAVILSYCSRGIRTVNVLLVEGRTSDQKAAILDPFTKPCLKGALRTPYGLICQFHN